MLVIVAVRVTRRRKGNYKLSEDWSITVTGFHLNHIYLTFYLCQLHACFLRINVSLKREQKKTGGSNQWGSDKMVQFINQSNPEEKDQEE